MLKPFIISLLFLLASTGLPAAATDQVLPGDRIDALTPEQREVAMRMLDFMTDTETHFWQALHVEDTSMHTDSPLVWDETDNGHYEIRVQRGDLVEKAGVMTITTRAEEPPFVIGGRWNRFIEVAVHPKTPLVGMLHATLSVQVSEDGIGNIGATMDMMQAAQPEEDLDLMRGRISRIFEAHEIDPKRYRPHGCGEPNAGFWKWHRSGTCTGVSLYGKQFTADNETFALVAELYTAVINTYLEILHKRANQSYAEQDVKQQDFMRRRWLEDQLFWDVLAKNFVPYEAWAAVNAPPVVKF